jgi:hypothetical protein
MVWESSSCWDHKAGPCEWDDINFHLVDSADKQHRSWERGRTVDDDAVSGLWAFCQSKHSELKAKAETSQRAACAAIRQEFSKSGINTAELLEEGHVFSRHFRAEEASRDSPTGLQVLVAAAGQVEACHSGSTSSVSQHQSTRDTQAQQQLGARNEGLITGQVLGSMPYDLPHSSSETDLGVPFQWDIPSAIPTTTAATARSSDQLVQEITNLSFSTLDPYTGLGGDSAQTTHVRGPDSGFASNSGIRNDSVAIGQAQTLGLQQNGNGQVAQHPWRMYADSGSVQGRVAHNAPSSGITRPSLNQPGGFRESCADVINWDQWTESMFEDFGAR